MGPSGMGQTDIANKIYFLEVDPQLKYYLCPSIEIFYFEIIFLLYFSF